MCWPRLLLPLLMLSWADVAAAVGAYVTPAGGNATMATLRAVLVREGNLTTLVVQPSLRGSGGRFAWIIPTEGLGPASDVRGCVTDPPAHPARPPCTRDLFARLHEETGAELVTLRQRRGQMGCSERSRLRLDTVVEPAFDLFAAVDPPVTVVDAVAAPRLGTWLTGRGYALPTAVGTTLADHATAGGYFVVVEYTAATPLAPDAPTDNAAGPVVIQVGGDEPVLPLLLTAASAAAEVEVLLYVIAEGRHQVAEMLTRDLVIDAWLTDTDLDSWYEAELAAELAAAGAPTFVVEHADFIDASLVKDVLDRPGSIEQFGDQPWFVTRLRARLAASALEDLHLVALEGDAATDALRIRARPGAAPEPAAIPTWAALLGVVGAGVAWGHRRRRGQ